MIIPLGGYAGGETPQLAAGLAIVLFIVFLIGCAAAALYVGIGIAWLFGGPEWVAFSAAFAIIMGVLWFNGPRADRAHKAAMQEQQNL